MARDHSSSGEDALLAAAKQGECNAAYRLYQLAHDQGHHLEARRWLNHAADLGQPEALYELADPGTDGQLSKKHLEMMRTAAEAGHAGALFAMGRYYWYQSHVPGGSGNDESGQWFQRAAEAGSTEAFPIAGQLAVRDGRAVDAVGWWRRIAAAGAGGDNGGNWDWVNAPDVDAVAREADAGGKDGLDRFSVLTRLATDDPESLSVALERAAKAGSGDAALRLGDLLHFYVDDTPEHRTTIRGYYQDAADAGMALALVRLGDMAPKEEAPDWYQRAADAGCPDGIARLGDLRAEHAGLKGDLAGDKAQAEALWTTAAGMGSGDAMLRLGYRALDRKDTAAGTNWIRQAAEVGNLEAMEWISGPENDEGREWRRRLAAARPCKPRYQSRQSGATVRELIFRITGAW
jgi:hypothetical protein